MVKGTRWEVRGFSCGEEGCQGSKLLLEWSDVEGRWVLNGVSCDHPRLKDLDNWECGWSCWDQVADLAERQKALA